MLYPNDMSMRILDETIYFPSQKTTGLPAGVPFFFTHRGVNRRYEKELPVFFYTAMEEGKIASSLLRGKN